VIMPRALKMVGDFFAQARAASLGIIFFSLIILGFLTRIFHNNKEMIWQSQYISNTISYHVILDQKDDLGFTNLGAKDLHWYLIYKLFLQKLQGNKVILVILVTFVYGGDIPW
ncbi:hypothetical protein ACJX0J_031425, partial [Zea mays]